MYELDLFVFLVESLCGLDALQGLLQPSLPLLNKGKVYVDVDLVLVSVESRRQMLVIL